MSTNTMKISASYSKKIQIKQYEPVEISCFVEKELDAVETVDIEETYEELFNFCKEQVHKKIALEAGIPIEEPQDKFDDDEEIT